MLFVDFTMTFLADAKQICHRTDDRTYILDAIHKISILSTPEFGFSVWLECF